MPGDVQWVQSVNREQLILVKRAVYDAYAVMSLSDFRNTEPYVEAVAVVNSPDGVVPIVAHRKARPSDGQEIEMYYPVGEPTKNGALFTMFVRQESADADV